MLSGQSYFGFKSLRSQAPNYLLFVFSFGYDPSPSSPLPLLRLIIPNNFVRSVSAEGLIETVA